MRRWTPAAVLAVLAFGVAAADARASQLVEIPIPARNGEVTDKWLPRYPNGGPPLAKVLLPDGYDPAKRYPLLVLLVGLSSNYSDWSDPGEGEIEKTAKGFPGIIVMPEGGDGWYADWWNDGKRSDPAWESYTLDQVIPQVLARYRIQPERRYHALAGVSMGGLGTAYLAGRLPGFFGSVAVISGLVDLAVYPSAGEGAVQTGIAYSNAGMVPTDPYVIEGPPDGFYEHGHNPVRLAANMAATRVFMTTGDGTPGADSGSGAPVTDQAEEGAIIHPASDNYAAALRAAGVALDYRVHAGYHEWANFRPELRAAIDWGLFKPVAEHVQSWVNDTVATHGKLWEFAYRFDAPPDRVVRFRRSGSQLSVGAAGSPVTITSDGGCGIHLATPADVAIPRHCARLQAVVRSGAVRAGQPTTLRVRLAPRLSLAAVRRGWFRTRREVRRLRVCLPSPGRQRLRVTTVDGRVIRVVVRVRGSAQPCAGVTSGAGKG